MTNINKRKLPRLASWRHTLAARLGLFYFIITLSLIVLLTSLLFSYFGGDVERSLLSSYSLVVNGNARTFSDLIARLDMYMNLISENNTDYLDVLREYDGDIFTAYHQYLRMLTLLKSSLNVTFGELVPDCSAYFIVDESMPYSGIISQFPLSSFRIRPTSTQVHITLPTPYLSEPWFQYAVAHPERDHWFTTSDSARVISVIRPISATDVWQGQVRRYNIGHIVVSFDAGWLDTALGQVEGSRSALYLYDADGTVLYSTDGSMVGQRIAEDMMASDGAGEIAVSREHRRYMWHNPISDDLTMVTLLPMDEIDALRRGSVRIVALIALLFTLVGLALILLVSQFSTRPIRVLARHMQRESLEPCPTRAHPAFAREVDWLYTAFNSQVEHINRLIQGIQDAEKARHETEMQLLQAQINPHFVCNALNSVSCQALVRGDDDMADTLEHLADIMRYNLRNPTERIPLRQELNVVNSYLHIQKVHSSLPIHVEEDIAADCMDALMPKLTLEPLVENAVSHGDRPDQVSLTVRREGGSLVIRVRNHSLISAAQINAHLSGEVTLTSYSTGLGIRNTHKRMRLLYSEPYGLTFGDLGDGFIEARLTLPFEKA